MDWSLIGNIATVVVPCFGGFWYAIRVTVRLAISENNETLAGKLESKYATKELIEGVVVPRLDKIERDYELVQRQYTEIRIGKRAAQA